MLQLKTFLLLALVVLLLTMLQAQFTSAQSIPKCTPEHCTITKCISLSDVTGFLQKLLGWLTTLAKAISKGFSGLVKALGSLTVSALINNALSSLSSLFNNILNLFGLDIGGTASSIGNFLTQQILGGIPDLLSTLVDNVLSSIGNMGSLLGNFASSILSMLTKLVSDFSVFNGVVTLPAKLLSGIGNLLSAIGTDLSNLFNEIMTGISNISKAITSALDDSNSIVSNAIAIKISLVNLCSSSKSVLVAHTDVCARVDKLSADIALVQSDINEIAPLASQIKSSITSIPSNILSLQNIALPQVVPSLRGQINACLVPSGTLDAGVQISGLTSSIDLLTNNLGRVINKLSGYSFSSSYAGTAESLQLSGIAAVTTADGSNSLVPVAGTAQLQYTVTLSGPVSVTGSTFSGQIPATISGPVTGTVIGIINDNGQSESITGTVTDNVNGVVVPVTVSGTFISIIPASLVITDSHGNTFTVSTATGTVTETPPGPHPVPVTYGVGAAPMAITEDGSGNLWVADSGDNAVTKLSPSGTTYSIAGKFSVGKDPSAIMIGSDGNVWVYNSGDNTVTVLSEAGTVIATYPFTNGVPTVTSVQASFQSYPVFIAGADFEGQVTSGPNQGELVYGTLSDYTSLVGSAALANGYINIAGGTSTDTATVTLSGSVPIQPGRSTISEGLIVALNNLQADVEDIMLTVKTDQCAPGYITVNEGTLWTPIYLTNGGQPACPNLPNADQAVLSGISAVTGTINDHILTPGVSAMQKLSLLSNNINKRFGFIGKAIHINPSIKLPASVSGPMSSDILQMAGTISDFANTISTPANELTALSDNIIRLGNPLDKQSYNIGVAAGIVGAVASIPSSYDGYYKPPYNYQPGKVPISYDVWHAMKIIEDACSTGPGGDSWSGLIDQVSDTGMAETVCYIYDVFQYHDQNIQDDLHAIQLNISDIRYYDTMAGVYVSNLAHDLHAIQLNLSRMSADLDSIGTIIKGQTINGAKCSVLSKDITDIQASANNLNYMATSPYGIQFDINGFIRNIKAAIQVIPRDIRNIIAALVDIVNQIKDFMQTASELISSATQNNNPIPNPGICLTVSYLVQNTGFPGAGYGCIVNANNLLIPIQVQAEVAEVPTLTASVKAMQGLQAQLTGTGRTDSGSTFAITGTVPVTINSGATLTLTGPLTAYLSGTVYVPYSIYSVSVTGTVTGTLTGTVKATGLAGLTGSIGVGATGAVSNGYPGAGTAGSITGGFSLSGSYTASYTVTGTATAAITCTAPIVVGGKLSISNFDKSSCRVSLRLGAVKLAAASGGIQYKLQGPLMNARFESNGGRVYSITGTLTTVLSPSTLSLQTSHATLNIITPELEYLNVKLGRFNPVDALVGSCLISTALSVWPSSTPNLKAGKPIPADSTVSIGQSVVLTANASGGLPPYSYQWYTGTLPGVCSTPLIGATQPTYAATPAVTSYYCYALADQQSSPPIRSTIANVIMSST